MRKLLLTVALIAFTICGFAQDFRTAGFYSGDRDFGASFQKKLDKYSREHFDLLQAGKIKEAAKLYSTKIEPLKKKIQKSKKLRGVKITTRIFSYTGKSHGICMRFLFPPANKKEIKASFNNLYFEMNLSPEMYLKIFESDKTIRKLKVNSVKLKYPLKVYAQGKKNNRKVHIEFVEALNGSIFKRGVLVVRIKNGRFAEVELYRQKKRFHGMLGYSTSFAGFSSNLKRTKAGVQLVCDADRGPFVTSPKLILEANRNRTGKAFKKIAAKQKK